MKSVDQRGIEIDLRANIAVDGFRNLFDQPRRVWMRNGLTPEAAWQKTSRVPRVNRSTVEGGVDIPLGSMETVGEGGDTGECSSLVIWPVRVLRPRRRVAVDYRRAVSGKHIEADPSNIVYFLSTTSR